ncbi:hypothetical protein SODALDRAFT_7944 [Sodiomyces alkalinus F11]|uniref:Uncharacterized protein n=1 Tax=Sodiomyces alkalinus (strain CBS 110278 / VKM F-3762 / F11) TaxID=1314773 RepID=A0A3N2Q5R6_SODAK|nr:hypothetical protein SODALDRAFT_7944 [Sodiomyces alkalinus F11]ROT42123.1 hypothetical protein SODALDRAFT_7944 [Sodiomyces alkalinus F11]
MTTLVPGPYSNDDAPCTTRQAPSYRFSLLKKSSQPPFLIKPFTSSQRLTPPPISIQDDSRRAREQIPPCPSPQRLESLTLCAPKSAPPSNIMQRASRRTSVKADKEANTDSSRRRKCLHFNPLPPNTTIIITGPPIPLRNQRRLSRP